MVLLRFEWHNPVSWKLKLPPGLSDLFVRLSGVHPRELRNSKTDLAIPMLRTGNGQKSFAYRGASLWNGLDLETKVAPSTNAFKSKLKEK